MRKILFFVLLLMVSSTGFAQSLYHSTSKGNKSKLVSKAEALDIAKTVCAKQGWTWKEPKAELEGDSWKIRTNSTKKGSHAEIFVDGESGIVFRKNLTTE